ncbi:uncharacterized protein TRAVEDRAFT_35700 [Trametes versicolor FP-101664 SS1]|uniref:uncharacterized protein n=1 Tax=Trametes versicolor (strain FP-101664) TaxID=717944 RepID=UPI0004622D79|nr:uncharacterized protein TRAVEDRAFT_35700 [Trametes versicolor FP-101664 SS1]EIW62383.1 hypothetical protein TRAVEDRAFT_35700 [Trametes versicolor FP-101664 SS1]
MNSPLAFFHNAPHAALDIPEAPDRVRTGGLRDVRWEVSFGLRVVFQRLERGGRAASSV